MGTRNYVKLCHVCINNKIYVIKGINLARLGSLDINYNADPGNSPIHAVF